MSARRQTVVDLVEEAKKRIVLLFVCVVGLSYLMSLTSSSVWVNLPAAAMLILFLRYISYDLDVRRRGAAYTNVTSTSNVSGQASVEGPRVSKEKSSWRRKVNSPIVEAAIDQFTRHLVSEWITGLWYSRLSPDKEGPEELVEIMNGVLGEISFRVRDVNLIDLLTRDIIHLICKNLELYRTCQEKIQTEKRKLNLDQWNLQLKQVMISENKLHPGLFSADAEHKELQHLMEGLISFCFRAEDLQCSFFRFTVRELLACAVIRPVLNLANPRFINERIENLVLSSAKKSEKGDSSVSQDASQTKKVPSKTRPEESSMFLDQSNKGLELVQFKQNHTETTTSDVGKVMHHNIGIKASNNQGSLPTDSQINDCKEVQTDRRSGDWGTLLDIVSSRKTQALAPEHFDNVWAKGRNYKKKDALNMSCKQVSGNKLRGVPAEILDGKSDTSRIQNNSQVVAQRPIKNSCPQVDGNSLAGPSELSSQKTEEKEELHLNKSDLESAGSYSSEDDETSSVTGLDSPGTKVWDSINKRNAVGSHIHHPLENSEGHIVRKGRKGHLSYGRLAKTHSGRKRSRSSGQKMPIWQEVERTSFSLADGLDILNASKVDSMSKEFADDSESESWYSGAASLLSSPDIAASEGYTQCAEPSGYSVLTDCFLKLRCEVLGANIVKSGSSTFAVYSISVTDANTNNWSIKRRFRHFEELHRRLKEFPEYNLSLPPKHFLSPGLDTSVVQARCKLLDIYSKKLLQLPTVSRSIEVWDFLSVDSQTYVYSNSLSVVETLSVDLDAKAYEKSAKAPSSVEALDNQPSMNARYLGSKSKESGSLMKQNPVSDSLNPKTSPNDSLTKSTGKDCEKLSEKLSGSDSDSPVQKIASSISKQENSFRSSERVSPGRHDESQSVAEAVSDPTLPTEWVPPNLTVPILNLVDVIFQLQDGGWIRRKAFWVAKQVLQLGMGDALDDWLIEKILLLRKGAVVASIINRVEQTLWPDGIFLTKHPKRRRPAPVNQSQSVHYGDQSPVSSPSKEGSNNGNKETGSLVSEIEALEVARRAKLVHEIMIDNAPAALVSLVGRKAYRRCAQDVYFFIQSPVCLKQLAFELLELLLVSIFPELQDVVNTCHEGRQRFEQVAV